MIPGRSSDASDKGRVLVNWMSWRSCSLHMGEEAAPYEPCLLGEPERLQSNRIHALVADLAHMLRT